MKTTKLEIINIVDWAIKAYSKDKEVIDSMENSSDQMKRIVGHFIKAFACMRFVELMDGNSFRITPNTTSTARSKKAKSTTSEVDLVANNDDPFDKDLGTFIKIGVGVRYIELMDNNSLVITPSFTGRPRSEQAECATTERKRVA